MLLFDAGFLHLCTAMFRARFSFCQDYEPPEAGGTFDSGFDDPRTVAIAKGAFDMKVVLVLTGSKRYAVRTIACR